LRITCTPPGLPGQCFRYGSWHGSQSEQYSEPSAGASVQESKELQAQLGHTDSRLTLSLHTQSMPEAQKQLACKIASVLLRFAPNPKRNRQRRKRNAMTGKDLKWCAQGDDFRTFLSTLLHWCSAPSAPLFGTSPEAELMEFLKQV